MINAVEDMDFGLLVNQLRLITKNTSGHDSKFWKQQIQRVYHHYLTREEVDDLFNVLVSSKILHKYTIDNTVYYRWDV